MDSRLLALAVEIACDPVNVGCDPTKVHICGDCVCQREAALILSGVPRREASEKAVVDQI